MEENDKERRVSGKAKEWTVENVQARRRRRGVGPTEYLQFQACAVVTESVLASLVGNLATGSRALLRRRLFVNQIMNLLRSLFETHFKNACDKIIIFT